MKKENSSDGRSLGQWNAWCEAGETFEERNRRLSEVPEELRERVLSHLKTVRALKKRAAVKNAASRRLRDDKRLSTIDSEVSKDEE